VKGTQQNLAASLSQPDLSRLGPTDPAFYIHTNQQIKLQSLSAFIATFVTIVDWEDKGFARNVSKHSACSLSLYDPRAHTVVLT
jgi:hypothetical protein